MNLNYFYLSYTCVSTAILKYSQITFIFGGWGGGVGGGGGGGGGGGVGGGDGGLHVTNSPIRVMCPMSVHLSVNILVSRLSLEDASANWFET